MSNDPLIWLEAVGTIAVLSYMEGKCGLSIFEFTAVGLVAAHSIVQTWNNYINQPFVTG